MMPGGGARELYAGLVGDPGGIKDDRFVARVQDGFHRLVDGVLGAAGDEHLVGLCGDAVLAGEFLGDCGGKRRDPGARGVVRLAALDGLDAGVFDMLRGIKVRLTNREADDVDTLGGHSLCGVRDLDRRRRGDCPNLL